MRKVDRSAVPSPISLDLTVAPIISQMAKAAAHYSSPYKVAFKFTQYKNLDVVAALSELFFEKCAYCESKFSAIAPTDVEHFRPKGRLEGDPSHCGYWWLALSWNNLLPSCIDCNRRRYHMVATPVVGGSGWTWTKRVSVGKLDAFPIKGKRAYTSLDSIGAELPVLIDPTVDDPTHYLNWSISLDVSIVAAKSPEEDGKGKASIRTYGLNRKGLVDARTERLKLLKYHHSRAEVFFDRAITLDEPHRGVAIQDAEEELKQLRYYCAPEQPYSELAREFYAQVKKLLSKRYSTI